MPKRCSKCKHNYANPAAAFGRCSRNRDGLRYDCKRCQADVQRKYIRRPEVKARRNATNRAWYRQNVERETARKRAYSLTRYHQRKRDKARWLVTLYRLRRDNGKP